jgi:hypothetical protein
VLHGVDALISFVPPLARRDASDAAGRVHHASRWRGGDVAARSPRAAARTDAADRCVEPYDESDPREKHDRLLLTQGLQELGRTEGRNVRITFRCAAGNVDWMRMFAKELVDLQPDVIVVSTGPVIRAVQQQTRTIPIIFMRFGDPATIVENLARPEGNITGFTVTLSSLGGKWMELLKEAAPRVVRVAIIFNPIAAGGYFASIRRLRPNSP